MGVFRKIKGVFYEIDKTGKEEKIEPKDQTPPGAQDAKTEIKPGSSATPVLRPKLEEGNEKVEELHQGLMDSVKQASPLLKQFLGVVESMKDAVKDVGTCYKAAFAALQQLQDITAAALLEAIDAGLAALDREKEEFKVSLETHQTELDKLTRALESKEKEIAELQKEVKGLEAEIAAKRQSNTDAEAEFEQALHKAQQELQTERMRMQSFIQRK